MADAITFDGMGLDALVAAIWPTPPSDLTIGKVEGEASLRRYYRLSTRTQEPARVVVMRLPESGPGAYVPGEELGFTNVQRYLRRLALPIPLIYADHAQQSGLLAIEDLGEETFEARLKRTPEGAWPALYGSAVTLLAALHERTEEPDPRCVAFSRSFDRKLLSWELDHFREWGLDGLGVTLTDSEKATLEAQFTWLVDALLALPQGFCHRDFQSRNLMWSRPDHLMLIDFQDALLGPFVYDLVALLCDSYVAVSPALQEATIARYARLRDLPIGDVKRAFDLCAVQRKLKDAGRFVFIDRVRKNPKFLPAFAPSLQYVERALAGVPELAPLRALLVQKLPGYPDRLPTPRSQAE